MTATYAFDKIEVRLPDIGHRFDTARNSPDNPAWAAVVARNSAALAAEATDLRERMSRGEGTPLRLVDFKKHMK